MEVVSTIDGVQTRMGLQDGALITGTVQDCTAILQDAKARHNVGYHGTSELKHAARLPAVVVEQYCNQQGIEFSEFMQNPVHCKRLLNDQALAGFRIWPGKV